MMFWTIAGALLVIVLLRLVWAVLKATPRDDATVHDTYAAQHADVQKTEAHGEVTTEEAIALRDSLARAALSEDAADPSQTLAATPAERRWLAALILILVPAIAVPIYVRVGGAHLPLTGTASAEPTPNYLIAELKQRIAADPHEPEPRLWLGRVYMGIGKYAEAAEVYAALNALQPDTPELLLQEADARAMSQQGALTNEVAVLVKRALELAPDNVTALWLSGLVADAAGQPRVALSHLATARAASIAQHLPTTELDALIKEVESRSGEHLAPRDKQAMNPRFDIQIAVAPTHTARIADWPKDTAVFVLAKAVDGPPMPLAVKRLTLGQLPTAVTLDDSLAMAPQFKLSGAKAVTLVARISRHGTATATSGDLEGSLGPISVGDAQSVVLTIDRVLP